MTDNAITLSGNLTRDPDLKFIPSGQAVSQFGLAVNRRYMKEGEWKSEVSYFEVIAWRELAENICSSLTKGNRVTVVGRLEQRAWETEDGQKRSTIEVQAEEVSASLRFATAVITKTERREPAPSVGYPDSVSGTERPAQEEIF